MSRYVSVVERNGTSKLEETTKVESYMMTLANLESSTHIDYSIRAYRVLNVATKLLVQA